MTGYGTAQLACALAPRPGEPFAVLLSSNYPTSRGTEKALRGARIAFLMFSSASMARMNSSKDTA